MNFSRLWRLEFVPSSSFTVLITVRATTLLQHSNPTSSDLCDLNCNKGTAHKLRPSPTSERTPSFRSFSQESDPRLDTFAGRFDVFKKAFQFERFAYCYVLYVACHKIGIGTERAWATTWATLSGTKKTAHLAPSSSGFHIAFGNCWFWDPRWLPVWVSANQPDTGLVWRSWRHQTVDGPAGPDAECSTLFSRHLTVQVLMVETAPTRIPWLLFSATILPVMFPWTCQDWFHSEEELREQLGLLNDVQDLASPCVVHPCLNSPWCPKIGWGVRIGWRCSAEL